VAEMHIGGWGGEEGAKRESKLAITHSAEKVLANLSSKSFSVRRFSRKRFLCQSGHIKTNIPPPLLQPGVLGMGDLDDS